MNFFISHSVYYIYQIYYFSCSVVSNNKKRLMTAKTTLPKKINELEIICKVCMCTDRVVIIIDVCYFRICVELCFVLKIVQNLMQLM